MVDYKWKGAGSYSVRRNSALGVAGVTALLLLSIFGPCSGGSPSTSSAPGIHQQVNSQATAPPNPFTTGMAARVAIGAPNLTSTWAGSSPNASSLVPDPELSCVSSNGTLWVPDFGGNRVLEFWPPFASGPRASVVLGQSTFTGIGPSTTATGLRNPGGCATDSAGDLWVSDHGNNRILEFVPPFSTGMAASVVLGQATLDTGGSGTSATTLDSPVGVNFDSQGRLWVADSGNNRVVEFAPPFSSGMAASLVLGQRDFSGRTAGLSAVNLSFPVDVASSGGTIWAADNANDRVVGFAAPFSTGESASELLGQSSFSGSGATGSGAFASPSSVSVDARGDLWVSDFTFNRVVEFLPPFPIFENASVAVGQANLTSGTAGLSATTLFQPIGAFVSPDGSLWVTDAGNGRILEYVPTAFAVEFSATGLPATRNLTVNLAGIIYSGPGPDLFVSEENGSYNWSVSAVPGYLLSPTSGTLVVNGSNLPVAIIVRLVTYTVTFSDLGLPSTSSWSVTLGGTVRASENNGSISFAEANGTYNYSISPVSGFNIAPKLGSVTVNGTGRNIGIDFTAAAPSGKPNSGWPSGTPLALVLIAIAGGVGLALALIFQRRRKRRDKVLSPGAGPAEGESVASTPGTRPPPPEPGN